MELRDKVVVITGGKRIGRVVAGELARRGMDLVLSYRGSKEEADQTVSDVQSVGRRGTVVVADVSKPADCEAVITHALATFGRVNVLINMASIYRSTPLERTTAEYWSTGLDINVRAALLCSCAAFAHMRGHGGGRVVNFADWLPRSGRPEYKDFTAYYVAKAGVIAPTESLALEGARENILVNAIAPGPIVPPPDLTQKELDDVAEATPIGRWGGAIEIAKVVGLLGGRSGEVGSEVGD